MRTTRDVTAADYRTYAGKAALNFTLTQVKTVKAALAIVSKNLAPLDVSGLPAEVNLVVTNDDGAGTYTRGTSIIVLAEDLNRDSGALASDLTHEMFHVLSRNDPKLHDALYKLVGFQSGEPVSLKLTPDVA